jgi:hypothetical protein
MYIHSFTFIQYIHLSAFAEVPLHFLIAGQLTWDAKPRVGLGPASQQADALPTELHSSLSYAAPLNYAAP